MSENQPHTLNANPERRRHFRVLDRAVVEYRPMEEAYADDLASLFPPCPGFSLRTDLLALDEELEPLLRRIAEQDRAAAQGLRLMGRKLDRLVQAFCEQSPGPAPVPVTLSEGGLSFTGTSRLAPGGHVALRVTLQPGGEGILSAAQVVYSQPLRENQWRTGLRFIDLSLGARDLIVRHMLAHQRRERRTGRSRHEP